MEEYKSSECSAKGEQKFAGILSTRSLGRILGSTKNPALLEDVSLTLETAIESFIRGEQVEEALNFIDQLLMADYFEITEAFFNSNFYTAIISNLKHQQNVLLLLNILCNIWCVLPAPKPLLADEELIEIVVEYLKCKDFHALHKAICALANLVTVMPRTAPLFFPQSVPEGIFEILVQEYPFYLKNAVARFSLALCRLQEFISHFFHLTPLFLQALQSSGKYPQIFDYSAEILAHITSFPDGLSVFEENDGVNIIFQRLAMASSTNYLSFCRIFTNHINTYDCNDSAFLSEDFFVWVGTALNQFMKADGYPVYRLINIIAENHSTELYTSGIFPWIFENFDNISYSNKENAISVFSTFILNCGDELRESFFESGGFNYLLQVIPTRAGEEIIEKYTSAIMTLIDAFPAQFLEMSEANEFADVLNDQLEKEPDVFSKYYEALLAKIQIHVDGPEN